MDELKEIAKDVRKDIIKMLTKAGSGHPGGSLSCVEILVTLYFKVLRHNQANPKWEDRDRFVLSKGHAAPTLYAVLSRVGYFPRDWLWELRKCGARLQGHPYSLSTPGVEASTGSLGQGLSIANGIALAGKIDKKDYRVYVLIGDGEIDEGEIWEASLTASRFKLDNLCAILDHNRFQIDGSIKEIKDPYPLKEKWQSFGWEVFEVDGHNFNALPDVFSNAKHIKGKPTIIIANTIKGKGVSFMENAIEWHGKAPNEVEAKKAIEEIERGESSNG
ncbi:MAG: transketolase [bacterium]|nr:transketolase [bacterium]